MFEIGGTEGVDDIGDNTTKLDSRGEGGIGLVRRELSGGDWVLDHVDLELFVCGEEDLLVGQFYLCDEGGLFWRGECSMLWMEYLKVDYLAGCIALVQVLSIVCEIMKLYLAFSYFYLSKNIKQNKKSTLS